MIGLFKKTCRVIRRDGLRYTLARGVTRALGAPGEIERSKQKTLDALLDKYDATVAYGPFKGMKLWTDVWWGKFDLTTKMLGVYEAHILERLCDFGDRVGTKFIDIGAADGYFAVGMAFAGRFEQVYAFEISERGRDSLAKNARQNGCSDQVHIAGEANYRALQEIIGDGQSAVVLIDIEGAEFDLLSLEMLELLRNCYVICELHPWLAEHGTDKQEALMDQAGRLFKASLIQREAYNPNQFRELDELSDEDRLLALGEQRGRNMSWLVLEPKAAGRTR